MAQVRDENTFKFVYHNTTCHIKCYYVHFMPGSTDRREGVDRFYKCCASFGKRRHHTGVSSEVCPTTGSDATAVPLSSQVNLALKSPLISVSISLAIAAQPQHCSLLLDLVYPALPSQLSRHSEKKSQLQSTEKTLLP